MAPDVQGIVREILTNALHSEGLANALQGGGRGSNSGARGKSASNGARGLSGMKGIAAGAGAAALAPLALKNAGKLARSLGVDNLGDVVKSPGEALEGAKSNVGDRLTSSVKDKAKGVVEMRWWTAQRQRVQAALPKQRLSMTATRENLYTRYWP